MVRDMTTGSPAGRIAAFSLPVLAGNLFQQLYNMADSMIVGRFVGVNAFAGVGSTGSLNFMILGLATGLCAGFSIPVSQDFGAGNQKQMRSSVAHAAYLSLAAAALLTILMVLFTGPILRLMNTPEEIYEYAYGYIFILFAGLGAIVLYNMLASLLRALGDSRTPLYFLVLSCVVNVALDYVLIVPCGMGVSGAAWATVIAQLLSGGLCLAYVCAKFPALHLEKEDWKFSWTAARRLLSAGLPMGLQFSITAIGTVIMQTAVNGLGAQVVAAVSAGGKVSALLTTPLEAVGLTMATYAGQNYGAGRLDRVRRGVHQAMAMAAGYSLLAVGIAALGSRSMAMLFIDPSETLILERVWQYSLMNSSAYVLLSVILVYRNTLQGLGYSAAAMLAGVFELGGRALVAFVLVAHWGFTGACFSNPVAWVAGDMLLLPLYCYAMKQLKVRMPDNAHRSTE